MSELQEVNSEIGLLEIFKDFEVHSKNENYSFIHLKISKKEEFLEKICKYILDESNLLQYVENNTSLSFKPTKKNYVKLFKKLNVFIDQENLDLEIDNDDISNIIREENEVISENSNKIKIRLSKAGKIGEYISHLILSQYFKFTCIVPKVSLTTDKNMSVFGIDELFISTKDKMLLFGESKISQNLDNGIALINKSLCKYEDEIREEFMLVMSEELIKKNGLEEAFGDCLNLCLSFEEFISKAKIQNIGIPLFIAHGNEVEKEEIINKMENKINKKRFFDLETKYYVISLPIIDKSEFLHFLTLEIKNKLEEYGQPN